MLNEFRHNERVYLRDEQFLLTIALLAYTLILLRVVATLIGG